jgi:hypothetical protein
VFGIDQSGIGRFGGVIPFSGRGFSAGILGGGDDLKVVRV